MFECFTDREFEMLKLVLDRGLFAAITIAAGVAVAKYLERYRRGQSLVTELGKVRAASFAEMLRAHARLQTAISVVQAAHREVGPEDRERRKAEREARRAAAACLDVTSVHKELLDERSRKAFHHLGVALFDANDRLQEGQDVPDEHWARIRQAAKDVHKLIPPLVLPD